MRKQLDPFKWIKKPIERASIQWPPRRAALKKASRLSQLKDKRVKYERQCNHCKKWFKTKDVQVDHIVPKGKYDEDSFKVWLGRLLCPTTGFQVLCIPCHKRKSAGEHEDGSYK